MTQFTIFCAVELLRLVTSSGVPRRGLGGLEPLTLAYDLRNKRGKKRQNMVFSTKKYEKIFWVVGTTPSPGPSPSGEGISPPYSPPPRRLRHLDPSHSKILGTTLVTSDDIMTSLSKTLPISNELDKYLSSLLPILIKIHVVKPLWNLVCLKI